jgi:hypothetical protein
MLKPVMLLAAALSLPACTQLGARARINPTSVAVYPKANISAEGSKGDPSGDQQCLLARGIYDSKQGAINLDCFYFPEDRPGAEGSKSFPAYDRAVPGVTYGGKTIAPSEAKIARNRLASILIKHADDVCLIEKGRLVAGQSTANFPLSFLTQSLSGASTIVVGDRAKSILSGLATLSAGTQDNVNASFYRNQIVQAIGRSLDQERERHLESLAAARPQDIEAYTVDDMIAGVNAYHQACSFEHGLQVLLDAALDANGAAAALESRTRDRALADLRARRAELQEQYGVALKDKTAAGTALAASLLEKIQALDDKIQGLVVARADKLLVSPNAGDTQEEHGPKPPPTDGAK